MDGYKTFPNLASCDIHVIRDGEGHCYILRTDAHEQLLKRGLWIRFCDAYRAKSRGYYKDRGHFIAHDAEQTIYELLTEGHP